MVDTTRPTSSAGLEAEWPRAHDNLSTVTLVEQSLRQGNTRFAANGALNAETAPRTGRSVKDKFIVRDANTAARVAWGGFNTPIEPEAAARLSARVREYLQERETYVVDAWASADPKHRLGVRVVAEYAWHALFAHQLFLRTSAEERTGFEPGFTILVAPDFHCDPARDGVNSDVAIIMDFGARTVTIAGTRYAGEIKKSVFSYLNYVLPAENVFPMHCASNLGPQGDVALFFGLSGTGKTTLSADPNRRLIGDDEHGWSEDGVFNFEGGCYAKCIRLKRESEPQIFDAIRFGAVLENVVLDPETREPNYDDDSLTENTRAAYPVEFIPGATPLGRGGHAKTILFLTADAFGVLPPVSRLTTEQALYYFLSGYTAKLAGTEAGLGQDPEATFSACFAAPFLALPPMVLMNQLRERMTEHDAQCYLVNTGWSGGSFGSGKRISLAYTRAMVNAAIAGQLKDAPVEVDPVFGLHVPRTIEGVPANLMRPRDSWSDKDAYDRSAAQLSALFRKNFEKFTDIEEAIREAGPRG